MEHDQAGKISLQEFVKGDNTGRICGAKYVAEKEKTKLEKFVEQITVLGMRDNTRRSCGAMS